jgi:hypothetical protein
VWFPNRKHFYILASARNAARFTFSYLHRRRLANVNKQFAKRASHAAMHADKTPREAPADDQSFSSLPLIISALLLTSESCLPTPLITIYIKRILKEDIHFLSVLVEQNILIVK